MSADNSLGLSTVSTAHPQRHPLRQWIARALSTRIPRSSTGSSTPIVGKAQRRPPQAPQLPTTYPHAWEVIHRVIHQINRSCDSPIGSSLRPNAAKVIYTGGHFSTRIGYLSTKIVASTACEPRRTYAYARHAPSGCRPESRCMEAVLRELSTFDVHMLEPPHMYTVQYYVK